MLEIKGANPADVLTYLHAFWFSRSIKYVPPAVGGSIADRELILLLFDAVELGNGVRHGHS